MKNDRKEGILIVNTDKPYKVSQDGNYIEKNQIVCREMDYSTEWIGADLYQMVMGAIVTQIRTINISFQLSFSISG